MKNARLDKTEQLVNNIKQYIAKEEKYVQEKEASVRRQLAALEEQSKNTMEHMGSRSQNLEIAYKNELSRAYYKLEQLNKDVSQLLIIDKIARIPSGIRNLKNGNFSKKKDDRSNPEIIDVHTVKECSEAVTRLEKEVKELMVHGTGNKIQEMVTTIFVLQSTIKESSEELVRKSIESERKTEQLQAAKRRHILEVERSRIEIEFKDQMKERAMKYPAELEKILPDKVIQKLEYIEDDYDEDFPDESDTLLYLDIPLPEKNPSLKAAIQCLYKDFIEENYLEIPVSMTGENGEAAWLMLDDAEEISGEITELINSVMYDVLRKNSKDDFKITFINPLNQENNFTEFESMRETVPDLFDGETAVSPEEIKETLRRMSGGTFSGNRLLAVTNFPNNFDEESLQLLNHLLQEEGEHIRTIFTGKTGFPGIKNQTPGFRQNLQEILNHLEIITIISGDTDVNRWRGHYCSEWWHGLENLEDYAMHQGACNMRKKYPYIINDFAYQAMQAELTWAKESGDLNTIAEYKYGHFPALKNKINEELKKDGTFPGEMLLGNVCYPKSFFNDPEGYMEMEEYQEIEAIFNRLGIKSDPSTVNFPWEVSLRDHMNLYLKGTQKETEAMTAFTNAIIWNFLDSMPVSKLNICVFDSEQKGNSFFPFLNFRKQCPEIFGKKIYTSTEEMYEQLRVLNEKINDFIQEKRGEYKDFLEYNENTKKRSEPATLLVIYDFPGNMDQRILNELMSIIQNGNACGIYTIICHNSELRYMGYEQIDSYLNRISENSINLECVDGKCCFAQAGIEVRPARRVLEDRQADFIQNYVEQVKEISKQGIGFAHILPEKAKMFQADSSERLTIPIGVGDGDQIVNVVMGEKQSHHALIAGATGSGKSVLLHSIIMSSMLKYSPEELQLYLMDFKSGTEFAVYDRYRLPHIRLLALDAMQEFGESILEHLVKEMEERADAFKEAGGLTKIRDYVEVTGRKMPRILVVMDEFQILYNDAANRKVAMHCAELTKRLVTEGRAYGIHLLMATQSTKVLMNLTLEAGTIEQMRIRIGLKCSEADSRYLFGDANCAKVLEMMKGETGTAVMSSDYTEDGVTGFRVAYSKPDQEDFLETIADSMTDYPENTQVFEGKRTEKLADSLNAQDASMYEGMPLYIHYGIPIKVAPPYIVKMTKKPKNNLLICCGANPKMANMVSNNYMVSALMNQKTDVYCMDGNILLEDDYERDIYEVMDSCTGRFKMAEDRGEIIRMIDQLYDRYKEQRKKGKAEQAIVVVLKNLEYLDIVCDMLKGDRVLREDYLEEIDDISDAAGAASELSDVEKAFGGDDLFGFLPTANGNSQTSAKPDLGDELLELLDRGAAYGIYFVVSTLDYQTVRETMVMGRNYEDTLKKFPNRIICGLQDNDAQALIPDVTLGGMENNTVYYTDGLRQKFQLKPFIAPQAEELEKILTR